MEIKSRRELPELLKYFNLPLTAIEIGVAGGANSTDLLKAGIEHIYCIDNWATISEITGDGNYPQDWHDENYKTTLKNLSIFDKNRYSILKGMSNQMHKLLNNNNVGLVYIDGWHSYEGCKEDIENYYPKLVKGGIIAFHDYPNYAGVLQAVEEFANFKNLIIHNIPETSRGDSGCWIQI